MTVMMTVDSAIPGHSVFSGFRAPPSASCRPIFPKQTHAQNSTLAIHVPTAMLSCDRPTSTSYSSPEPGIVILVDGLVGAGTISGLSPRMVPIPASPTTVDRIKPGLERSTRYHSTGLTRARVSDACAVDCQCSLRLTLSA